ncbi:hypothetical protein JXM67_14590 [candidate division WOR-3 bacterium]|nr:hypothetical protein [candidate division WOR-3 bacterium]
MDYEVWFDDKTKMVKAKVLRSLTKESAQMLMIEIENKLVEMNTRQGIMDLTEAEAIANIPKEVREVYKEHALKLPLDRAAILVNSPILRMAARVVLAALGKTNNTKFFKTEVEALAWLKGEE